MSVISVFLFCASLVYAAQSVNRVDNIIDQDGWVSRVGNFPVQNLHRFVASYAYEPRESAPTEVTIHPIDLHKSHLGGMEDMDPELAANVTIRGLWEINMHHVETHANIAPHFQVCFDAKGRLHVGQYVSLKTAAGIYEQNSAIQIEVGGDSSDHPDLVKVTKALLTVLQDAFSSITELQTGMFGEMTLQEPRKRQVTACTTPNGNAGVCKNTWECSTASFKSSDGANGCQKFPSASMQCCSNPPSQQPDPQPQTGGLGPCTSPSGVSGQCMEESACSLSSYASRDGASGCKHFPSLSVKCCAQSGGSSGGNSNSGSSGSSGSTTTVSSSGSQGECTSPGGKSGFCKATSVCEANTFKTSAGASGCAHLPAGVECCAPPGGSSSSSGGATGAGCAGAVFPLASGSLSYISKNFGNARGKSYQRCHCANDIYTKGDRTVVASYDGVVSGIVWNFLRCKNLGGPTSAILVYHNSGPLKGKTINYGEVDHGTFTVKVGSRVFKGKKIGRSRNCAMLHFEMYTGRQSANIRWPGSYRSSGCAGRLHTKPAALINPLSFLTCVKGASASGFLMDEPKGFEDPNEADELGESGIAPGIIALIAVSIVLVCALLVLIVVVVARRKRAANVNGEIQYANHAYASPSN